ncbi:MAG: hypothetical protein KTR24_07030, partial [Saprospiraceae bacterium]|nr:hypothetical protein [Saprospiraceae bacterium]
DNLNINSVLDLPLQAAALAQGVVSENYRVFFDSSYKYLVLIVMELIIFQVAIRTIEIVKGKKEVLTVGLFARAQVRMIKVAAMNFVLENIGTFIVHAVTGLLGFEFLDGPLVFFVQCFFLGHTIMDNYNEIQQLGIKESYHFSKHFPGVSFGIGVVLYVLLLIPIIGPLVGPIAACIAATLVMYQLDVDKDRASIVTTPSTESELV